ncbi:Zinc finger, CCCH-type [Artemisia annua]|uniref:Zinc finger, CCCH-type n=1 Tax=Artemisia annua TaxID=35608 RepID=A0A2U1PDA8_ARTAN|nr:Zinc finger, CCCH-type [Artemisia annua]
MRFPNEGMMVKAPMVEVDDRDMGSECEYRHSDVARVNPRDCYYWLSGNCLNPKCAFRHPPLDGLVGADGSTPVGPSVPPAHPAPDLAIRVFLNLDLGMINMWLIFDKVKRFLFRFVLSLNCESVLGNNVRQILKQMGSECEYRHSDVARVNPRDCYYWLSGNCLNPKCAFRHPPLDGLVGADGSTPVGPSVPPAHPAPYAAVPKQGVACIFFQKGFCLKGPLCPFLHGPPNTIINKPTQTAPTNPIPELPKASHPVQNKPIQEQKFPPQVTTQRTTPFSATPFSARNGAIDKRVPSFSTSVEEPPRYKPARVVPSPVLNEQPSNKFNRGFHNDRIMNGKDADVYSREPSPGFDVLVDNEIEDGEYHHEKEESFAKSRSQDYNVDRIGREQRDFDNYTERDGQYIWDETRQERRPYLRNNSPDQYNRSDLRQRISNQRRAHGSGSDHGSRSVASREYADRMPRRDNHRPDYRQDHRQDREAISSRLQGRIKLPGRSTSPPNGHNLRTEREIDTERKHLSRFRDRISDNDTKFAGPKKLSELKTGGRIEHQPNEDQSLGKRKYSRTEEDSSSSFKDNHHQKAKEEHNSVPADFEPEKVEDKPADGTSVNNDINDVETEDGLVNDDAPLDEELEAYEDDGEGEYEYEPMDGEEGYEYDEGEYADEVEGEEYEKKDGEDVLVNKNEKQRRNKKLQDNICCGLVKKFFHDGLVDKQIRKQAEAYAPFTGSTRWRMIRSSTESLVVLSSSPHQFLWLFAERICHRVRTPILRTLCAFFDLAELEEKLGMADLQPSLEQLFVPQTRGNLVIGEATLSSSLSVARQRFKKIKENIAIGQPALADVFASVVKPLSPEVLLSLWSVSPNEPIAIGMNTSFAPSAPVLSTGPLMTDDFPVLDIKYFRSHC